MTLDETHSKVVSLHTGEVLVFYVFATDSKGGVDRAIVNTRPSAGILATIRNRLSRRVRIAGHRSRAFGLISEWMKWTNLADRNTADVVRAGR